MRLLLPLLSLSTALAFPTGDQVVLNLGTASASSGEAYHAANLWLDDTKKAILEGKKNMEKWFHAGKEFIKQNGMLYELVSHPSLAEHKLRVTEPDLCDSSVKQYSGYLDIAEDKHLFFWFFESRNSPSTDPLVLWLNGGPGCSSSTGMLFELGPCSIASSSNTTFNKHSWTESANVIFLDQPVNVGFSYADDSTSVNTSPVAGQDVYAFLELFVTRYPKYSKLPLHISGESYAGTYLPHIASAIWEGNKHVAPGLEKLNFESILIGNGLTNPAVQFGTVADYACNGPYPVFDDPEGAQCTALRTKIPTCQRLLANCERFNSRFVCAPALLYCNSQIMGPPMQTGVNQYDVRRQCNPEKNGKLCYEEMVWVESWMNQPKVKTNLGVDPALEFQSCNMDVLQSFTFQGDGAHNSAPLLTELINGGVRLLIYAGNADLACNFIGNERWLEVLDSNFQKEFGAAKPVPWVTADSSKLAGSVRSAGGKGSTAGNVTFVTVFEAGHMVPFDQPEAALDMFTRWITNVPLS